MKTLLAAAAVILCGALPAAAESWEEVTPYLSAQHFYWRENHGGRRILKETGPVFAIGAIAGLLTDSAFTVRGRGEFFGGQVRYKGETQAPESVPVNTQVNYFGTREEIDLGYRLPTSLGLEPFAGIGHRWWVRDLNDATTADGSAVSGYIEKWQAVYARTGARAELDLPGEVKVVAEAGAKYPFYVTNRARIPHAAVATFHPRGRWSGFAEAGIRYRNARLTLVYEGTRFSQSPLRLVQGTQYFQPDSSSDTFGLSLGWDFR